MTPDDPRHGTYAGWQRHRKDREKACGPCKAAEATYHKRMMYQLHTVGPTRVELGEPAWAVIDSLGRRELSRLTGLRDSFLSRLHKKGPTATVYRRTRDTLLAARPAATPVGVQRRLRALVAVGYTAPRIADEVGMSKDGVLKLLEADGPRKYHRDTTTTSVVAAFDRLSTAPMPTGSAATAARNRARRRGWPPPLAWDNIDDPRQQPAVFAPDPARGRPGSLAALIEDAEWLADDDLNLTVVTERLGIDQKTFHSSCRSADRMDLYWRLADRDPAAAHRRDGSTRRVA